MLGAVVGDIVGSRFEHVNARTRDFELFTDACHFTDDTVHTLAVCRALVRCGFTRENLARETVRQLSELSEAYSRLSYGARFNLWRLQEEKLPYASCGNGAAMRVSGCALAARTLEEALALSDIVTGVTHSHPDGLRGARAVTETIFLARRGVDLFEVRRRIHENYYPMDFTLEDIRGDYCRGLRLNTCANSVPQALQCFFEAHSLEDAVRNAVSIGGDSDTLAAIAGSAAAAAFGIPAEIAQQAANYLDARLGSILEQFEAALGGER